MVMAKLRLMFRISKWSQVAVKSKPPRRRGGFRFGAFPLPLQFQLGAGLDPNAGLRNVADIEILEVE